MNQEMQQVLIFPLSLRHHWAEQDVPSSNLQTTHCTKHEKFITTWQPHNTPVIKIKIHVCVSAHKKKGTHVYGHQSIKNHCSSYNISTIWMDIWKNQRINTLLLYTSLWIAEKYLVTQGCWTSPQQVATSFEPIETFQSPGHLEQPVRKQDGQNTY
jgi:hypothetical protein